MNKIVLTLTCLVTAAVAVDAAAAGKPEITQASVAKAALGLPAARYQTLFGSNGTQSKLDQPDGWSKLEFDARKVSVYFANGASGTGTVITTWNRNYRTARGVGPCSTLERLKHAYRHALRPSKFNTQHGVVYAWTVGENLIFATNGTNKVGAVGLYDGSAPNARKEGGTQPYAGFITLNETTCS